MKGILKKLNYKGQKRIAILNFDTEKMEKFSSYFDSDVRIDTKIDLRFPYEFVISYVDSSKEVKERTPAIQHNLVYEGVIWYFFPRHKRGLSFNRGWKTLFNAGLSRKKEAEIDKELLGVKYKNPKFGE